MLEKNKNINSSPVIKSESVYKIFGNNAEKLLEKFQGKVDAQKFQDAGCIVGVNNASFEVHKGEMLVVMGLSGSGKSTLLRCISRLTEATSGKIFIDSKSSPSINMLPDVASVNLEMHLSRVDLPEPDKPITTSISPLETSKEALLTPTIHPFS